MRDECSSDLGAHAAVVLPRQVFEVGVQLVGKDCGNLRHGSAYRKAAFRRAPIRAGALQRPAAGVLEEHGFTGERLLRLARRIANDWLRRSGGFLDDERMDDLVGFLVLQGCRAATRYDPERVQRSYGSGGGDPFASYLADIMQVRVTDWYRSKREGNGDRRYGHDKRLVLDGEMTYAEPGDAFERELAARRQESGADLDDAEAALGEGLSEQARWGLRLVRLSLEQGEHLTGGPGSGAARKAVRSELEQRMLEAPR
jgi:hypothetical protein